VAGSNQNIDSTCDSPSFRLAHALSRARSPWLMWLTSLSFVLFQFCIQLSSGVMIHDLIQTFHLTALGAGVLSGSYYFIYVFMQTPAGILVDRVGPRRLLSGGAIVCSVGCALFSISSSYLLACSARILMGAGSSFAFVSTLYLIGKWFPKRRFAMMTGVTETVGMLGTLVGNLWLSHLLTNFSWRYVMLASALLALLIGVCCYIIIRDKVNPISITQQSGSMQRFLLSLKWMLLQPRLWINGLYSGFTFCIVTVFAALWALPFLMLTQQVSLSFATFESSFIFLGMALGGPLMGILYQQIDRKTWFLSGVALLSAVTSIVLIYATPSQILPTALLFLILGVLCSSYVFNYTYAKENTPTSLHATSIGFTNTICMITAPIFQPIVGWILYLNLGAHESLGDVTYSLTDYHSALAILPINQLLAALIILFIPMRAERIYRVA
jgi:MFS family permease